KPSPRAVSSAGRAPALHAGCRRFESVTAHQRPQLCVSRLFAELPRLSNKILGVNHPIIEHIASADVDRALAVVVEKLNPEKKIAGRKAMRRLIQSDFIWPIAYKRRCYRFVAVLGGQSELHVRPKQFSFKIRSIASLVQHGSFQIMGCRLAIIRPDIT